MSWDLDTMLLTPFEECFRSVDEYFGCGMVDEPRVPWDESPRPRFCPDCGLDLLPALCPECEAPMHIRVSMFNGARVAPFCAQCGTHVRTTEPKMRVKPSPEEASRSQVQASDVMIRLERRKLQ